MKTFAGYALALVAVVLVTALALETSKTMTAKGQKHDVGLIKNVLCEEIEKNLGASLPFANAEALCGPFVKLVFVTSTTHSGDLKNEGVGATGAEGADNICNARAQEAGLPGTYTAWLSTSAAAKDRVTHSAVPYVRTDGQRVADDYADLIDCTNPECLQAPLSTDETGSPALATWAWTGTQTNGLPLANETCGNFDNPNHLVPGASGLTTTIDALWTDGPDRPCGVTGGALYCFRD